jgi:hypothetical protein
MVYDPADPMGKCFAIFRPRSRSWRSTCCGCVPVKGWRSPGPKAGSRAGPQAVAARQAHLLKLRAAGGYTIVELVELFEVSRQTVYRVLERAAASAA